MSSTLVASLSADSPLPSPPRSFSEKILGLASRRGTIALAFRRRVVVYSISGWEQAQAAGRPLDPKGKGRAREQDIRRTGSGGGMSWLGEWETCDNLRGELLAVETAREVATFWTDLLSRLSS